MSHYQQGLFQKYLNWINKNSKQVLKSINMLFNVVIVIYQLILDLKNKLYKLES